MSRTHSQRYFEDVEVGVDLPTLTRGPLTTTHLMRWAAAMENWHKIHYDQQFAVEHDKLPGIIVNGTLKQQIIMMMLKDWAGLEGWAWKLRFQLRAMDIAGTTLNFWAKVTAKIPCDGYGVVEMELGTRNLEGRESTPGAALVALPFKGGNAVPYPFVPPHDDPWARRR